MSFNCNGLKIILALTGLFLVNLAWSSSSSFVVLTNKDGTSIECKLLRIKGNWVRIVKSEREFSIKLDQLNLASRATVEDWAKDHAITSGELYVNILGPVAPEKYNANDLIPLEDGTSKRIFSLELNNTSNYDLDGVEIEYKVYWLDGRVDISDPFYFWKDCHHQFGAILKRQRLIFNTESILIKRRDNRRDSILGIYIRIYRNAKFLREYVEPDGLLNKVEWNNFSLDALL